MGLSQVKTDICLQSFHVLAWNQESFSEFQKCVFRTSSEIVTFLCSAVLNCLLCPKKLILKTLKFAFLCFLFLHVKVLHVCYCNMWKEMLIRRNEGGEQTRKISSSFLWLNILQKTFTFLLWLIHKEKKPNMVQLYLNVAQCKTTNGL